MNPITLFKRGWIASGHKTQTYGLIPYPRPFDFSNPTPDFVWLDAVSLELKKVIDENSNLYSEENELQAWPTILKQIESKGLQFPAPFKQFIESPVLQKKVPTCTDCFLSLSNDLIPMPDVSGHFLLRFLNDSQSCYLWYFCLNSYREPWVVASPYFFDKDIFRAMEYEDVSENNLVSESYLCAETYLEFIYRFWLENTVWFSEYKKLQLTPLQKSYQTRVQNSK